jgi:uncharacterized delta-60 repeat protein
MRNGHFAILATLLLVASATTARAETMVSHFKIKGNTGTATFRGTDPNDPCVEFFVSVVASDQAEKTSPPKSKVAGPRTVLFVGQIDTCFGITIFSADGESLMPGLQIAGDLRSATLQSTATVFDSISLQFYDFDINLTWTATGPAVRQNSKETFRDPDLGLVIKSHNKGVTVPAEVVGTVVGLGGQNVTPEPSVDAEIQRLDASSLTIEKVGVPPFIPQDIVRTLDGTATTEAFFGEQAVSVTTDGGNNVIAAGHTQNTGTGGDFTAAKWDTNGNLLWLRTLNGTANTDDFAHAVTVDSQNNVIAAGLTRNANTGADFTVAKWDASGNLQWLRTVDGAAEDFFFEQALAVAVDSQDNVVAAGLTDNTGDGQDADFTVAKLDSNGHLLWLRTLDGSGRANAVVVDSSGSVIAAGHSSGPNNDDFLVAKWNANGNLQWVRTLNGTADQPDDAFSVAVDSQDSVVVAGFTRNTNTREDFTVAKWDTSGNLLWLRTINGDGVFFPGVRPGVRSGGGQPGQCGRRRAYRRRRRYRALLCGEMGRPRQPAVAPHQEESRYAQRAGACCNGGQSG